MRSLLSIALACCFAACPARAAVRYGVVLQDTSGVDCLVMAGPVVAKGTPVLVVLQQPQGVLKGVVGSPREVSCGESALLAGTSYEISVAGLENHDPAVAVIAPGATGNVGGGMVLVRTPGVRTPLSFATCTSNEGLHLTAWRGGRRVWHAYYYLGFDVEPSCTEKEARD